MATPSSVRFEPGVLERLSVFVAAHPGLSLSSASNQLIDEALRMQEHLLIVFRDGPAGRRGPRQSKREPGGSASTICLTGERSLQRSAPERRRGAARPA